VLHDHFPLAAKYRLKGVHLNSRNPEANFKGAYWTRCSISRSCHSLEEVAANKDSCNYVTLSPVFDSISKAGYNAGFSYQALKDASENGIIDSKVVALGGISPSNIASVINLRFGGAAVLGTVWNQANLQEAIVELGNLIKKMNDYGDI
jgi:thiamine monophosphate synthase